MDPSSDYDSSKSSKLERYNSDLRRDNSDLRRVNSAKIMASSSKLLFRATVLTALVLILLFALNCPSSTSISQQSYNSHRSLLSSALYGYGSSSNNLFISNYKNTGVAWEKQVKKSATPRRQHGMSILVTGAAGFVGTHCSLALKKRGEGVVGPDNFNSYYDPSLKRDRESMLNRHEFMIVDGNINDGALLAKLFNVASLTHVLHLAAQAGVRYAMENPQYVASNIAGLVNLFEISAKTADPQPARASSSSNEIREFEN